MRGPEVTRVGLLDMQVCVPSDWTDEQVETFANGTDYGTGISSPWRIRKEGHPDLAGAPERVTCAAREGFVHIMLEC